jgi:hypothetical protein
VLLGRKDDRDEDRDSEIKKTAGLDWVKDECAG